MKHLLLCLAVCSLGFVALPGCGGKKEATSIVEGADMTEIERIQKMQAEQEAAMSGTEMTK